MDALNRLAVAVERYIAAHGDEMPFTANKDLGMLRSTGGRHPNYLVLKPTLCVVVRGAKQTTVGHTAHEYHAGQALVVTVDVPGVSVIAETGPDEPYLSVVLALDALATADVLSRLDVPPAADAPGEASGVFVLDLDEPFLDCILRAVQMLDTPDAISFLYPALQREIAYRLLTGPRGADVAALTAGAGQTPGVTRAVYELLRRFAEPLRAGDLAALAHLSPSAFNRRFKAVTSMTPLQYQKQIRLLEARRLMLTEASTAEAAAYGVGYESASQFRREYARMFGGASRRDVQAERRATA